MKTAPEYPWGGCLLRLNASGDNRPGAQGKLTLRARLHIPVSFRAVPERHDSMIGGTHRRGNAIFAHLLPGQSHMVGAHPRSPVGLPAETPALHPSSPARPTATPNGSAGAPAPRTCCPASSAAARPDRCSCPSAALAPPAARGQGPVSCHRTGPARLRPRPDPVHPVHRVGVAPAPPLWALT